MSKLKNIYYTRANGSLGIKVDLDGPSRVQQQFKDDVDINRIMKKYKQGIPPTHINRGAGFYADFSGVSDYQTALNQITLAQSQFLQLPSNIRKRFSNDPQLLMEFLSNSANKDEAIKLGLVKANFLNANDSTNANINQPPTPPAQTTSPQTSNTEFPKK